MATENINIRQIKDGDEVFYPQTDIHGLVNNGEYAIDDEPTAGSDNLVKSGGVYNIVQDIHRESTLNEDEGVIISDDSDNEWVSFDKEGIHVKDLSFLGNENSFIKDKLGCLSYNKTSEASDEEFKISDDTETDIYLLVSKEGTKADKLFVKQNGDYRNLLSLIVQHSSITSFNSNNREKCSDYRTYNLYGNTVAVNFHQGRIFKNITDGKVKFALISDSHINECPVDLIPLYKYSGRTSYYYVSDGVYNYTKVISSLSHIDSLGLDFILGLGDIVDYGYTDGFGVTEAQIDKLDEIFTENCKNLPFITMGGNHDIKVKRFSNNKVFSIGCVNFILLEAQYNGLEGSGTGDGQASKGVVSVDSLLWLDNVLTEYEGEVNIVCCHYCLGKNDSGTDDPVHPSLSWWMANSFTNYQGITIDGHRQDLIDILSEHNVKLFLNGHEHDPNWHVYNVSEDTNINDINCGSLFSSGYGVCEIDIANRTFEMKIYSSVTQQQILNTISLNI